MSKGGLGLFRDLTLFVGALLGIVRLVGGGSTNEGGVGATCCWWVSGRYALRVDAACDGCRAACHYGLRDDVVRGGVGAC